VQVRASCTGRTCCTVLHRAAARQPVQPLLPVQHGASCTGSTAHAAAPCFCTVLQGLTVQLRAAARLQPGSRATAPAAAPVDLRSTGTQIARPPRDLCRARLHGAPTERRGRPPGAPCRHVPAWARTKGLISPSSCPLSSFLLMRSLSQRVPVS
jgi:hypothetical protein